MKWRCWVRVLAEVKVELEDDGERRWMRWRWRKMEVACDGERRCMRWRWRVRV